MTSGHSPTAAIRAETVSSDWLSQLKSTGPDHDEGLRRLHQLLRRACHSEARRRAGRFGVDGPELNDVAEQAASDAMLTVLRKLPEFRGDSLFSTWVYKFAIFEVSAKLSRHHWNASSDRREHRLDADDWKLLPDRFGVSPADVAGRRELIEAVREVVARGLTERQRSVFVALVVEGVPLDVLTQRLGSSRGAIYKTMFDARRKIRAALVADGYLGDE
jgi:RNA polymerase sigma-70 factor, ECF subfamily